MVTKTMQQFGLVREFQQPLGRETHVMGSLILNRCLHLLLHSVIFTPPKTILVPFSKYEHRVIIVFCLQQPPSPNNHYHQGSFFDLFTLLTQHTTLMAWHGVLFQRPLSNNTLSSQF